MDFCTYFDVYLKMTQYGSQTANCLIRVDEIACVGCVNIICNQCSLVEDIWVALFGFRLQNNTEIQRYNGREYAICDAQEHREE